MARILLWKKINAMEEDKLGHGWLFQPAKLFQPAL
jgi:hypothetical protein